MQLALFGKGKMGMAVQKVAESRRHTICDFDPATVCIDFSHPDVVIENIKKAASQGKNIVVGTTGWYDQIEDIKKIIEINNVGFIWAANFSIGVHLFIKLAEKAALLFGKYPQYDAAITEIHHREKVDAPSGTAKVLGESLLRGLPSKRRVVADLAPKEDELLISSVRIGSNPGSHTVLFDSPTDTVTLSHQSHNREAFALGAVIAAEWISGKKGFYTIDDLFN